MLVPVTEETDPAAAIDEDAPWRGGALAPRSLLGNEGLLQVVVDPLAGVRRKSVDHAARRQERVFGCRPRQGPDSSPDPILFNPD